MAHDLRSEPQIEQPRMPGELRRQFLVGSALLAMGLLAVVAGFVGLRTEQRAQLAQASGTTSSDTLKDDVRPTTPAPEPARPDGNTTGSSPSSPAIAPPLPPAPAEKIAPPIPEKK